MNSNEPVGDTKTIFVIEDDPDINRMLCFLFHQEGYQTLTAVNGQEALTILKNQIPDLILLDLWMPVLDAAGFRAVQELDSKLSEIPVIVMSADDSLDIKSLKLGLNHHVKKPIEVDSLLATIQSVLQA